MESFPFDFCLNYKMENCNIKPPANFTLLSEVVAEKYDLKITNIFYVDESGVEKPIKNDIDYSNLLMVASDLGVKEIELIIKSNEDISQKRKKRMRKRSSMKQNSEFTIKQKSMSSNNENDTYANDMMCDYDYFGDTRNRKVGMEEGKWSNQCTNFKDDKRIYYIKKKKEQQRLYKQALPYLEKARKALPALKDKWGLPLYTIYLNLNMGEEFEEIDRVIKNVGGK